MDGQLFEDLGLLVSFDERGTCNAVGVGRGLGADWEYAGYLLLSHPARGVRTWALRADPELDPPEGFTSRALGWNMWADWSEEEDLTPSELAEPAASFLAFRPGDYEEERARMQAAGLIPA